MSEVYHPEIYKKGKWKCCGEKNRTNSGCQQVNETDHILARSLNITSKGVEMRQVSPFGRRDVRSSPVPIDPGFEDDSAYGSSSLSKFSILDDLLSNFGSINENGKL